MPPVTRPHGSVTGDERVERNVARAAGPRVADDHGCSPKTPARRDGPRLPQPVGGIVAAGKVRMLTPTVPRRRTAAGGRAKCLHPAHSSLGGAADTAASAELP